MKTINGDTQIYPIIGDPISQVKSPEYLTSMLYKINENGIVIPLHVIRKNFLSVVSSLKKVKNIQGMIITIPHKTMAFDVCDVVSERASIINSVNIITKLNDGRLYGDNVDGIGYMDGSEKKGFSIKNKKALIIGAGGAGAAVALEMLRRDVNSISIYDIDYSRVNFLIERLNKYFPKKIKMGTRNPMGYDFIANVSPVGMNLNDPYPIEIEKLNNTQFVADAITQPKITPLLKYAINIGCTTMSGYEMFNAESEILVRLMIKKSIDLF